MSSGESFPRENERRDEPAAACTCGVRDAARYPEATDRVIVPTAADCPVHGAASHFLARVAALFVYADGVYADFVGVDLWDEARNAMLYHGPLPVVAHPPCKVWSLMSNCRPEIVKNEDGGMFEASLSAVRTWGGVLEHPAHTRAWKRYGLPRPAASGWTRALDDPGWTCEVDQRWYGHEANKPTWLYYVGPEPLPLMWGRAPKGHKTVGRSWGQGRDKGRSGTPWEFASLLLQLARSVTQHRLEVASFEHLRVAQ